MIGTGSCGNVTFDNKVTTDVEISQRSGSCLWESVFRGEQKHDAFGIHAPANGGNRSFYTFSGQTAGTALDWELEAYAAGVGTFL